MDDLEFYKTFINKKLTLYNTKDYILKEVRKLECGLVLGYFDDSCVNIKLFKFDNKSLEDLYNETLNNNKEEKIENNA